MMILISIIIVFGLIVVYLFLLCPNCDNTKQEKMNVFENCMIAHRGFFDNRRSVPENSITAFKYAVEHNYGIELDVQLTNDGKLVVFHDESLSRMCQIDKNVRELSYDELNKLVLLDTEEKVPLFSDVLRIIDGKVPLIVEVKSEGDVIATTKAMAEIMDSYVGPWCMESFNPRALSWFKKNRSSIIRGQLSTNFMRDKINKPFLVQVMLTNLMCNWIGKPDFIAYNHIYANQLSFQLCTKLFPVTAVAWTIHSQMELENALKTFSVFIFDGFVPKR